MISLLLADGVAELILQQMLVLVVLEEGDREEILAARLWAALADQMEATVLLVVEGQVVPDRERRRERLLNRMEIFSLAAVAEADMDLVALVALVAVAMVDVLTVV